MRYDQLSILVVGRQDRSFIAGAEIASCIAVGCMEGPRVLHRKQIRQAIGHMDSDIGLYYKMEAISVSFKCISKRFPFVPG